MVVRKQVHTIIDHTNLQRSLKRTYPYIDRSTGLQLIQFVVALAARAQRSIVSAGRAMFYACALSIAVPGVSFNTARSESPGVTVVIVLVQATE